MDISRSKRENLQKDYEDYIRGEQLQELESFDFDEKTETRLKNSSKKPNAMKLIFFIFGTIFFVILAYVIFLGIRIHNASNVISTGNNNNSSLISNLKSTALALLPSQRKTLSGEESGRINILLLGAAGEKKPGKNLTDTIMIASINTKSKKIALLSLPRDMYVQIPSLKEGGFQTKSFTKINGLYQYGLRNNIGANSIKKSVEEITGIPIQYYLVVDFDGFVKFIDALDGININVERDIYDNRYPGPNYSYEIFELKKGLQKLDGETALKYVRERHSDPLGDFGRAKRQQQAMQSVKNKAYSIKTILNPIKINELISSLEENIKTNLTLEDIESLLVLSRKLDTQNISTEVVDAWQKDSLLKVSHVFYNDIRAFVLVPKIGNYSQIHHLAENIFDIEKIERRKAEIEKENANILIVNKSGDRALPQKIKTLLSETLKIKNITISTNTSNQIAKQTEVFDLGEKSKIFTLDELIRSVPAKLSTGDEYKDFKKYDFVLALGEDMINMHKFEEANIDDFKNANDSQEYFEIYN